MTFENFRDIVQTRVSAMLRNSTLYLADIDKDVFPASSDFRTFQKLRSQGW
jgi:hypothetical protein